ncbi:MAG: hypothetical protein EXS51_03655 [Candidatus Taylorbacteria bacterium]|nr:hypothetical protein [Candidatus Taylorbacteria bacterium]
MRKPLVILIIVLVAVIVLALWSRGVNIPSTIPAPSTVPEITGEKPSSPAMKSPAVKKATTAYTQTRVLEKGRYVSLVNLTNTGFMPKVVEINRGETVRFVNKSGSAMRIASGEFEGTPLYVGLNQEKSVGQNGVYELVFTESGVWTYHNLSNPNGIGVVYVK